MNLERLHNWPILHAAAYTLLAPILFFPFYYCYWVYRAFIDVPGSALRMTAGEQFFYNFSWGFSTAIYLSIVHILLATSVFYISIPALFSLNFVGAMGLSRLRIGKKMKILLSFLIAAIAYALFWYFVYFYAYDPVDW